VALRQALLGDAGQLFELAARVAATWNHAANAALIFSIGVWGASAWAGLSATASGANAG